MLHSKCLCQFRLRFRYRQFSTSTTTPFGGSRLASTLTKPASVPGGFGGEACEPLAALSQKNKWDPKDAADVLYFASV